MQHFSNRIEHNQNVILVEINHRNGIYMTEQKKIKIKSYLKFLKPHQRQQKYLSLKLVVTTSLRKASANIPNLYLMLTLLFGSHLLVIFVRFSQYCLSGLSILLQSRKLGKQERVCDLFSWSHCIFQQLNCLPIDDRYQVAPVTCSSFQFQT